VRLSGLVLALLSAFPAQAQQTDVAGRLSNLNYIATEIPKLDRYFFDHLNRAQFQRAVDDLSATMRWVLWTPFSL